MFKIFFSQLLFLLFFTSVFSFSQEKPEKIVSIKVVPKQKTVKPGSVADIELILNINKGWHINANKPLDANLIPTTITLNDSTGYKVTGIDYPQPVITKLAFSENELALYEDEVIVKLQIKTDDKLKGKKLNMKGKLRYQPCNDKTCLFPVTKEFDIYFVISKK